MTAPALNPAPFVPPAAAGAAPSASGAPAAAAGAFEALMTALFPQAPAAAGAPAPAADSLANADLLAEDATAQDAEPGATDAEGEVVSDAAATALAASLQGAQPNATQAAAAGGKDVAATAPAWGRDKPKGAPAQPALLHANARADLAGKAEPTPEYTGDDSEAPAPESARPSQVAQTLPPQASAQARAATQAAPPPGPASPPPTADAAETTAPPPPVEAEGPAAAAPSNTAASGEAAVTASANLAQRPETAQAQPGRATKSERRSNAADAAASDPKPREASEKPALAKSAEAAAKAASAAVEAGEPETAEADGELDSPDAVQASEARAASQTSAPSAQTAAPVRGSPETVAALAAQIIKKLEGKSTRFDVELDPAGLGKVDVRVEIGAHGRLVASMVFENPQAAQDLKARAGELQRALEQAGFDLSGGLSFDAAGDRGRQGQAWQEEAQDGRAFQGRAFRQALDTAGDADAAATQGALRLRRGVSAGLDLRI